MTANFHTRRASAFMSQFKTLIVPIQYMQDRTIPFVTAHLRLGKLNGFLIAAALKYTTRGIRTPI
jgi:hypothetical protein